MRSVRCGGKVRQDVVATLAKLDAKAQSCAKAYANKLTDRRRQPSLFEPGDEVACDIEAVLVKAVRIAPVQA